MTFAATAKIYSLVTKPGIMMGNALTAAAGFFLASRNGIDFPLLGAMLSGLMLIIASACVCNNYIDRKADVLMARTQNRALVKGVISPANALRFALALGVSGALLLGFFTTLLALEAALFGFVVYVALYSFLKYRSVHATLVGSIAGAIPPVVGYSAVSGRLDTCAFLLFAILVFWQMPHFFAIAIYRLKDYTAASIPVLPVKKGIPAAKVQMLFYTILFFIASLMPAAFGYAGYTYLIAASLLGLIWLGLCVKGFTSKNDTVWARKMFLFSLVVITVLSIVIPFP